MENEVIVNDIDLGLLLRNTLIGSGNRNPRYTMMDYKKFTLEELSTITSLKLEGRIFRDISALRYCVNLRELSIISAKAKHTGGIDQDIARFNYLGKKNNIRDFSVISELESLEFLTIQNDDNIMQLDISNLKKLKSLDLTNNSNLTEIIGLEEAEELSELYLYENSINKPFDLLQMVTEGKLFTIELDIDMYHMLKDEFDNLDEFIEEQQKNGISCLWKEKLSDIRHNRFSTLKTSNMDRKAQDILSSIIKTGYSDIEKVAAIYDYITANIRYDHESLAATEGEKNEAYKEASANLSERTEVILDRQQSSYNAILQGKAVCEGYTNMMHYLLKSVGIESRTVLCSADSRSIVVGANSNHSVIKVEIEGDWYYFDPTWDAGKEMFKNFFKTKDEFSKNHVLSMTEESVLSPETKAYTDEEITSILSKVKEYRRNIEQHQILRKDASGRDGFNIAYEMEQDKKQNIYEEHENNIYHNTEDFDNRTSQYSLEAMKLDLTSEDYYRYIGTKLGNIYSKGLQADRAELAREFAILEVKGRLGDFEDPYERIEVNGYDNPKLLLQLEKVNGLTIEENNDTIGFNLGEEIFIATYEIEEYNLEAGKTIKKPIFEYYQKNENGQLMLIGSGTDKTISFCIDEKNIDVNTSQIITGETVEKVTQQELATSLIKSEIEDSMGVEQCAYVSQITDFEFLKDFSKQCGLESEHIAGKVFITSIIGENGVETFEILLRQDPENTYKRMPGINPIEKKDREILTTSKYTSYSDMEMLDTVENLNEFVTKSGKRYCVTRNEQGGVAFNEILGENENIIYAQHVDTYEFLTEDSRQLETEMQNETITESPVLPIATEVGESLKNIASEQRARDIQSGHAEIKQNYISLERPEIAESKSID